MVCISKVFEFLATGPPSPHYSGQDRRGPAANTPFSPNRTQKIWQNAFEKIQSYG